MRIISLLLLLAASLGPALAEQSQQLGPWTVHYNAFNSTFLSPQIASQYDIRRSRLNAVLNVAVQDAQGKAQAVALSGEARDLLGHVRTLSFREVREGEAIYYLAQLPFRQEDTFRFEIQLQAAGQQQLLKFQQTFYEQ